MRMRRESILERMSGAMNQYLLGIDIGTSACKIAIFDEDGQVKASASGTIIRFIIPIPDGQSRIRKNGGRPCAAL